MDSDVLAQFWRTARDNDERPIFVPIQSPPFSRIPPASMDGSLKSGEMIRLQIVVNKDSIIRVLTSALVLLVLIPVIVRLRERLKLQSMRRVRKHLQMIFIILNLAWIIGCIGLLMLSAHILFVYDRRAKIEIIEEIFPWYVMTIVLCCVIEMIESMLGLYDPVEEWDGSHRIISIKSSLPMNESETDEKPEKGKFNINDYRIIM